MNELEFKLFTLGSEADKSGGTITLTAAQLFALATEAHNYVPELLPPTDEEQADDKPWSRERRTKEVRWADIHRAHLISGLASTHGQYSSMNSLLKRIQERVKAGLVIKTSRGCYRMVD